MTLDSLKSTGDLIRNGLPRIFNALWAGAVILKVLGEKVDPQNAAEYMQFFERLKALASRLGARA